MRPGTADIFVGVMSGSSLDGVDVCAARFESESGPFELLAAREYALDSTLKNRLKGARSLDTEAYFALEAEYSAYLVQIIGAFLREHKWRGIGGIGIHGHTVLHHPEKGFSIQMVNGGWMATQLSESIFTDFRNQDIGGGGQGAPLAPVVELLFPEYAAFLNLGGIANLSYREDGRAVQAYDVGPCNQLLNHLARLDGVEFDRDGRLGRSGRLIPELMAAWSAPQFFAKRSPKSLDNHWIQENIINCISKTHRITDALFTAYAFISEITARELNALPAKGPILTTGGGAHNTYLIESINQKLSHSHLYVPDRQVVDFKEALLMAYLAYLRKNGKPLRIKTCTGSAVDVVAGAAYSGKTTDE